MRPTINRRHFLGTASASLAATTLRTRAQDDAQPAKPFRVGLIGCGWYGKSDVLRLIQVAPVEVVPCVTWTRRMLAEAAELISAAAEVGQASRGPTRTTARCWREKDLRHRPDRLARTTGTPCR